MRAPIEAQPWFLPFFLIVWAAAMAYVIAYLGMAVRHKRMTGQAGADWITVFFDPATRRYFRWMFTNGHAELGDAGFSRHVYATQFLFAVALALMAAFFLVLFVPALRP